MFGRFLGRFFWNFYDYLGTNLLLGTVATLACIAVAYAAVLAAAAPFSVVLRMVLLAALAAVMVCLVSAVCAGMAAFATRAARDEAARVVHFRTGAAELFRLYLQLLLLMVLVAAIVGANVIFYGDLARAAASIPAKIGFVSLAMLFAWGGLGLLTFALAAFAAPARYGRETGLREALRRAAVLFFVTPGTWLAVTIFVGVLWILCGVSVVGIVFALPVLATASTTTYHLSAEHAQFLARAREELGSSHPVRVYKRRAAELTEEADARRPRRTLRELIRPWEA